MCELRFEMEKLRSAECRLRNEGNTSPVDFGFAQPPDQPVLLLAVVERSRNHDTMNENLLTNN